MKGYQIPFLCQLHKKEIPKEIYFSQKNQEVVSSEIENLLKKVATEPLSVESQQENQLVSNIFLVKKGWQKQACHQPQKFKSIYPVQSFQNGMSAVNKRCPKEGKLYVQTRSEGYIFLHPTLREY